MKPLVFTIATQATHGFDHIVTAELCDSCVGTGMVARWGAQVPCQQGFFMRLPDNRFLCLAALHEEASFYGNKPNQFKPWSS